VVQLVDVDGSPGLPAVDGSNLTGVEAAPPAGSTSISTSVSVSVPTGPGSYWLLTPTANATVTLASPVSGDDDGKLVRIKNLSAFEITINAAATIDGQSSFALSVQYSSISMIAHAGAWYIV
jgi:hypothetical protein